MKSKTGKVSKKSNRVPQEQKDTAFEFVKKGVTSADVLAHLMAVSRNRAAYLIRLVYQRPAPRTEVFTHDTATATWLPRKESVHPKSPEAKEVDEVGGVDVVNSPAHYTKGGIETIDFIEAKGLGYCLGNVVKYVSRVDEKDDPIENLEKAEWYLKREIAKRKKEV